MTDLVTCPQCGEVSHIGGLIGDQTNDCPRCGRPALAKPLEWQALWDAMDARPDDWIPTTEHMFWEMLECLPPRAQNGRAFLVGEPLRHDENGHTVHACFRQTGNEYHAKNMTVAQFRGVTA